MQHSEYVSVVFYPGKFVIQMTLQTFPVTYNMTALSDEKLLCKQQYLCYRESSISWHNMELPAAIKCSQSIVKKTPMEMYLSVCWNTMNFLINSNGSSNFNYLFKIKKVSF